MNCHMTKQKNQHLFVFFFFFSVFQWNNETINIWTHLLGFIYFTYQQYNVNSNLLPPINATTTDHIVTSISIFCTQVIIER